MAKAIYLSANSKNQLLEHVKSILSSTLEGAASWIITLWSGQQISAEVAKENPDAASGENDEYLKPIAELLTGSEPSVIIKSGDKFFLWKMI